MLYTEYVTLGFMLRHTTAIVVGTVLGVVAWEARGDDSDGLFDTEFGLLPPVSNDVYGPGVHSDATGRPFQWVPVAPAPMAPDPLLRVKPNAYGPGVGMDQYGRPVRARPLGQ